MWTIDGEPEHFPDGRGTGGYDGDWWKWWLRSGETRVFTVVKSSRHVLMRAGPLTDRTRVAAETRGRSEVERHLLDDLPPRGIELRTGGREPLLTLREDAMKELPSYSVQIADLDPVSSGPLRPEQRTPEVRSVVWSGEAADEDAAKSAAWHAWDEKYGHGRQPVNALVKVTSV